MERPRGEGSAENPTPRTNLHSRMNKSISAAVLSLREVDTEIGRVNRLAPHARPYLLNSLYGIYHLAAREERMGSEVGFAQAMLRLGYPENEVMEVWNTKLAIDREERGLTRDGLPGFSGESREPNEGGIIAEVEGITRAHDLKEALLKGDSETGLSKKEVSAEDILSALADPEEVGISAIQEMLTVRGLREAEAARLGEPYDDSDEAADAIFVSNNAGLAHQNEKWVGAVVGDEDISPDHAEQLIADRFEGLATRDVPEDAGVTMDDARQIAQGYSIYDSSLEEVFQAQFKAGKSYSDGLWLDTLMGDDEISVGHLGEIAAAVSNDSD
jgi:hypothetical protein